MPPLQFGAAVVFQQYQAKDHKLFESKAVGEKLDAAVRQYQRDNGLSEDDVYIVSRNNKRLVLDGAEYAQFATDMLRREKAIQKMLDEKSKGIKGLWTATRTTDQSINGTPFNLLRQWVSEAWFKKPETEIRYID